MLLSRVRVMSRYLTRYHQHRLISQRQKGVIPLVVPEIQVRFAAIGQNEALPMSWSVSRRSGTEIGFSNAL